LIDRSIDRSFISQRPRSTFVAKDLSISRFSSAQKYSFHKLALGTTSSASHDSVGAIDAASCDPVERKFAQIVLQCMKEAAAASAAAAPRNNDDNRHSSNTSGGRLGAAAAVAADDPRTFCGGDTAAAAASSVWSMEAMDLD
jgi:hypothetical protein